MFLKHKKRIYLIVIISTMFLFWFEYGLAFSNQNLIHVLQSDDEKFVWELKPYEVNFVAIYVNDETYQIPQIDGYEWLNAPGKPRLPMGAILLGIPPNARPNIKILEIESSLVTSHNIYPSPELMLTGDINDRYFREQFVLDRECYSQNRFFPHEIISITSILKFRRQRIARVEFRPLQYNPVTKELKKIDRLKVAIIYDQELNQNERLIDISSEKLIPADSISKHLLENYEAASRWRNVDFKQKRTLNLEEKLFEWYNSNTIYYKLLIPESGIYRLDYNYLLRLGIDIASLDPRTIKIFNKGKEIPLSMEGEKDGRFDPDDEIVFYGQRNMGENSYFDLYTDVNIYWLTWGEGPGLRMGKKSNLKNFASERSEYIEHLHFEQDKQYYQGDNSQAIINTEQVSGEGWIWCYFFPGESEAVRVVATELAESQRPASLKIKLRGTTIDPIDPDHHIEIILNDSILGDAFFEGTEEYFFETNFLSLQEGENNLKLRSVGDTGAKIDQFYLDWIEVTYPRQFIAKDDQIEFSLSDSEDRPVKLSLWGFSDSTIQLIDLTHHSILEHVEIDNGNRFIFKVTSAGFNDGFFIRFNINAEPVVSEWHRGHNLVVVHEVSGQVLDTKHYDTHASSAESDSMARYILKLTPGRIVMVGIMDEGQENLTESAYSALESLGSKLIRNLGYRDSWAMIGRKGAPIGSVPEEMKSSGSGVASVRDTLTLTGSGKNYYLTFADTVDQATKYIAFSANGVKYPDVAKLDTSDNLRSTTNEADLIIVTHNKFLHEAQRLAHYRATKNGFRVKVADVENIYDEFNFGLMNPRAIKDFLKFAYENWQPPRPSYVIFLGDASTDFKKNLGPHVNENFVPSYGSPVSDNWFACFDGDEDFLPEMVVGRIPVASEREAESVIDKIIAYENSPSAGWKKNILFVTGGFNRSEQTIFMNQSNAIINQYILPPPASCRALKINKTTEGYFEGEKKKEILDTIDGGTLWVNFIGHAGSLTWDLMFNHPDIDELNNENQYPLITSMTCHTGRFAEPEITSFGEHFLLAENKGAVAFLGTTGWGFVFQDNILLRSLFRSALIDTVHRLGEATTLAKLILWRDYGESIYNISTIHQYTLLGDPTTDLALPEQPDLTIGPADVTFHPSAPTEADSSVNLAIKVHNWGLASRDSFLIEIFDTKKDQNITQLIHQETVPPLGLMDSLTFNWRIKDQAGEHYIRVFVDTKNQIEEINEDNNEHEYALYIYSSQLTISKPFNFQIVTPNDINLQINNPVISTGDLSEYSYQFAVDTTDLFNSPVLKSSSLIPEGKMVTRWKLPALSDQQTYFWRCRTINETEFGKWETASFFTQADSTPFMWCQKHLKQFIHNHLENTKATNFGCQIQDRQFILQVQSAGYEDGNFARILVNYEPVIEPHRGHNVAGIDPKKGQVLQAKSFDTLISQDEADSMASLINGLPDGTYVLIGIMDEGSYRMTENAYLALESIGSKLCRQVGYRDSYAIIGIKGRPIGSAKEQHVPVQKGIATVQDTLTNYFTSGTMTSPPIGPANKWHSLIWMSDLEGSGTNITVDVLGFNKKLSQWDTLFVGIQSFLQANLISIDAKHYPLIKLKANLTDDGLDTPYLHEWAVSYAPVPDPAISPKVVSLSADTLMETDILKFEVSVFNIGMENVDSVALRFSLNTPDGEKLRLLEDKILTEIPIDSYRVFQGEWHPSGKIGNKQLIIEVDPDDRINELTEANNYFSKQIVVLADTMKPRILVTYDGKNIVSGDFVSNSPEIFIKIYDDSPFFVISDTTKINLFLDNYRVSYFGNEDRLSLIPANDSEDPKLQVKIVFTPELNDGEHSLEVFVKDKRNNFSHHRGDFQVISEFKILNVFNYPNPFQDGTEFTFHLTQPADRVIIKVYTIAGRLLRTLEGGHYEAGFHRIAWNGLDQDRNTMANGVYLYKIVARSGDKHIEKIEKLVIMR